ncbi:rpsA [Symbiodinium pilosum]|uniref:RpsA protein n=1 Tax=Symbiodinium pilosum TaxID=2952 RepID=A0A812IUZ9_SYMPI|nr:rpsA [Symbiodinium pilosum]
MAQTLFCELGIESPVDTRQEAETDLQRGSELTVYITDKQSKSGKVTLALQPSHLPKQSWEDIIADGQTPYNGVVRRILDSGVLVDIGYDSLCFLPNSHLPNNSATDNFRLGQHLTVYAVQKRVTTGRVSLALERRPRPLDCPWKTYPATDHDDPALLKRQSTLKAGDMITVYPICKDLSNGRVYLSMKKREAPILSVWDLSADGQTAYPARVVSVHGKDCTMDLGADMRGLLTRSSAPMEGYKELEIGETVQVYIIRRNSGTGSLTLSLTPWPFRKVSVAETFADFQRDNLKVYDGEVYCIQHGHIFLDIGSEVGAVMPDTVPLPSACQIGDHIRVTISHHDPRRGRFCVMPADLLASQEGRGPAEYEDGKQAAKCIPVAFEANRAVLEDLEDDAMKKESSQLSGPSAGPDPPNAKGRLQEVVQKETKQVLKRGDIVYTVRRDGELFSAEVRLKEQLLSLMPTFSDTFQGDARRTKVQAEHSAAQEALRTLRVGK